MNGKTSSNKRKARRVVNFGTISSIEGGKSATQVKDLKQLQIKESVMKSNKTRVGKSRFVTLD